MRLKVRSALRAILLPLLSTGCVSSKATVYPPSPSIEYRQQAGLENLPSPAMPTVPPKGSGDRALADFAAASYAGLLTCKMTIDGHNALLEDVKGLAQ